MEKLNSLSVFFPAYNEEENIKRVVENALQVLPSVAKVYEVIVVNDGSRDRTEDVVKELEKTHPQVRLVNHEVNKGYGGALKTGFQSSLYEHIVFTHGDGQFDFAAIRDFIPQLEKADLVIGYRLKRNDPFTRLVNAKLYALFLRVVFGLKVKEIDCAFKLFKKEAFKTIPPLASDGALISAELLIRAKKANLTLCEVPVKHYPRVAGNPTGANIGVIFRMFREVAKLYRTL